VEEREIITVEFDKEKWELYLAKELETN